MDILLGPKFSLQNSLNVYIGNFVMESSCFCTFIVLLHSYLCSLLKVLYSKPLKIGITCLHVLLLFCLLFAFFESRLKSNIVLMPSNFRYQTNTYS